MPKQDPVEVMRAAGLEPCVPYPGSKTPWLCECRRCGQTVCPLYNSVQQGTGGCKHCGKKQSARTRTMAEEKAVAEMCSYGVTPLDPFPGVMKPWRCQCVACGEVITPSLHNARRQGVCGYCSGTAVRAADAEAAMRAAGAEPQVPYPGGNVQWPCRCTACGRAITPRYASIRGGQSACRYCTGHGVIPEEAVDLMREAGMEPQVPYPGADTPWPCRCTVCQRTVAPTYNNVRRGRSTCGYCSGARVDVAQAKQLMVAAGLQPLEAYPGANVGWRCRCLRCGWIVKPAYGRVVAGGGCPECAPGRIRTAEPALLYLIVHHRWQAAKVGIAADDSLRLREHLKHGWTPLTRYGRRTIWRIPTGGQARALEQALLTTWRDGGAPQALSVADMPQGGATETAFLTQIDLEEAITWLDQQVGRAWRVGSEGAQPTSPSRGS
ncbi:hypothetical protein [Kineococcus glutinatus]